MRGMTISRKLFLLIAASGALLAISLIVSFLLLQRANSVSTRISQRIVQANSDAFQLVSLANGGQNALQALLRERDPDRIEALVMESEKSTGQATALIAGLGEDGKEISAAHSALLQVNKGVLEVVLLGEYAQGQQRFIEESAPAAEKLFAALDQRRQRVVAQAVAERDAGERTLHRLAIAEGLLLTALLAGFIVLGLSFARSIVRSLQTTIAMLRDIAEGEADLTKRLAIASHDEMGELGRLFNVFLDHLQGLIRETKSGALLVNSSALQISTAAEEVAATTEEQSQQAQSVASAVQQLAATSDEISATIDSTRASAQDAATKTREGSDVIRQSISTLQRIKSQADHLEETILHLKQSTDKIGGIVGVINGVADQTNLLALNAAIEAARAGDAGRGFAVVADEVRKLAEHTAKATKEIGDIITRLQQESSQAATAMGEAAGEVQGGTALGEKSLQLLDGIIVSSQEIDTATASISTAIGEESATISDINNHIQGIATGTGESARAVQDIASTAGRLAHESEKLKTLVERFKTD